MMPNELGFTTWSGKRLSRRLYEVAVLLCMGMSEKEVAFRLDVTVRTVKLYVCNLRRVTGAESLVQLGALLALDGVVKNKEIEPGIERFRI